MSEESSDTERAIIEPDQAEPPPRLRREQPLAIRCAHWLNVPLLTLMAASGLQILYAYPNFGPRGALYGWYPLQGTQPPSWLRFGGWLAGARHWHFALGLVPGPEWRTLSGVLFCQRRMAPAPVPAAPRYAQRIANVRLLFVADSHTSARGLLQWAAAAGLHQRDRDTESTMVLSGLAIYKPVQLHWLAALFGGYDGARMVHFTGLCLLAAFRRQSLGAGRGSSARDRQDDQRRRTCVAIR